MGITKASIFGLWWFEETKDDIHGDCLFQVYTSGKGSSAAGLTASVMKDPQTVSSYLYRFSLFSGCGLFTFKIFPINNCIYDKYS